ncbi:MAG: type II CAAX endopeptidase family protein [Candidatus Zixiibacteriota bacterium]
MNISVKQIRSFAEPAGVLGKIVQFPLVRTVIAILFVVVPVLVLKGLIDLVLDAIAEPAASWIRDIFAIVRIAVAIYFYGLFVRFVEKRKADEMSLSGSLSETGWGIALGAALMTVMVGLFWVLSYYRVESIGPVSIVIHGFFFFAFAALMEEVVFRVILFRHVEELIGSWGAIVLTGLLFGFVHQANPNATTWTSTAIALQSIIIAGCYVFTRRVWLVFGLHAGWNYFQSSIYGVSVSGADEFDSLLVPSISGPAWITGDKFGIEGSYVTTVLCLIIGILLVMKASRMGQLVGPLWVRKVKREAVLASSVDSGTTE